jgi:hypothetical protein
MKVKMTQADNDWRARFHDHFGGRVPVNAPEEFGGREPPGWRDEFGGREPT